MLLIFLLARARAPPKIGAELRVRLFKSAPWKKVNETGRRRGRATRALASVMMTYRSIIIFKLSGPVAAVVFEIFEKFFFLRVGEIGGMMNIRVSKC